MRILGKLLRLACAYKARVLCNGVFVSGLDPRRLSREDVGYKVFFHLARARVDRQHAADVDCSILGTGLFREKAVHVDGIGAVLLSGTPEEAVRAWPTVSATVPASPASVAVPGRSARRSWPAARDSGIDVRNVEAAVGRLFDDRGRRDPLRTRAVLIVQDGRIVCERYAPGFGPDTRLLSWSMAKSVVSVLVGILAGQGRMRIDEPAQVPEWADERDPRHAITVNQLLRMSSGLAWTETYGEQPISDVNQMLFFEPDMARFAAGQPLAAEPGTAFFYSSGSTNIICRIVRGLFANREEYLAFPHRALFDRIGMRSAVWGTDASGTLVGSSYLYATGPRLRTVRHVLPCRRCLAGRSDPPRGLDDVCDDSDPDGSERRIRRRVLAQPGSGPRDRGARAYPKLPTDLLRERPPGADDRHLPVTKAGGGSARHDVGQRVGQGGVSPEVLGT